MGDIWRAMLQKTILIFPKKRDNLFAGVTTFLTKKGRTKDGRL